MNENTLLPLSELYFIKIQQIHRRMMHLRMKFQRSYSTYRKCIAVRDKLTRILCLLDGSPINKRSVWSLKKNGEWWSRIVLSMSARQFKENFRVERSTFSKLVQQLDPYLRREDTILRPAIPVDKRVACALYALGSTSELRTVANLFGIGKSTAGEILHEFCATIVEFYFNRFITFPSTDTEIADTACDFLREHDYPLCLGAVDGTHIIVKTPLESQTDYYNYKKYHSIVMLASVNANLQFNYVQVGASGRCNDASIYSRSNLADVIQSPIYTKHSMLINGVKVQAHLIADSAFALNATLMKPYPIRPNMPREQSLFNYRLSRCRSTVERAFGALKNRFRCLSKKMEFNLEKVVDIIKACAVLHNLCISVGDGVEIDWDLPDTIYKKLASNVQTTTGAGVREALTQFFVQNPL